jgi:hypothetical protein
MHDISAKQYPVYRANPFDEGETENQAHEAYA